MSRHIATAALAIWGASASPALADDTATIEVQTVSVKDGRAPYGLGVGVVLGEPTGLSFAVRADSNHAVQAHASWSFYRDWVRFNIDYLPTWVKVETDGAIIPIYAGIGGVIGAGKDKAWLGARVPIGVAVHPKNVPLEPFIEVAPVLYLAPETAFGVDGAIGLRYYF